MSNQCEHGQLVRTCLLCEMRGENLALRAQLEKALDAGVGYSQQTVDAIAGERDKLRAENVALKDALSYWLPEDCPLAYQDDPVSRAHRKEWVKTAKLIDDDGDGDQAFKARGEALMQLRTCFKSRGLEDG